MSSNGQFQSFEFPISKGVSMPDFHRGSGIAPFYPFARLEVGDSFFIPGKIAAKASVFCVYHGKKLGRVFRGRTVTEGDVSGCRIWRVK